MYKKLRKTASILFIMFSLLTLFGPIALASEMSQGLLQQIEQTNDYIYKEIDKAKEKAEKEAFKNQSEQKLNQAVDKIIDNLLENTEKRVDKLIKRAGKEGVELERFYIDVQILDRTVPVDPFYAH